MQNEETSIVFDHKHASSYDKQFAKLAPIRHALNLLIRMVLSDLPADSRILCVGVGTGLELMDLARAFPPWRFTALEPAAPMLDICLTNLALLVAKMSRSSRRRRSNHSLHRAGSNPQ